MHEQSDIKTQCKTISIALCGNPNSGKTSLFNELTGSHQHVGNWPGVTVEKKKGTVCHEDYAIEVVDLPGTYSLTAFSLEEIITRNYILEEKPDIIINVVDATNMERNLYLTTQLIEMGVKAIVTLNVYDEAKKKGISTDIPLLSDLLGMPVIPTVANRGEGIRDLLNCVLEVNNVTSARARPVQIHYKSDVEQEIDRLQAAIKKNPALNGSVSKRWIAIKLLEQDGQALEKLLSDSAEWKDIEKQAEKSCRQIEDLLGDDSETFIADGRYGFIRGVMQDVCRIKKPARIRKSELIDRVLTNRILGFPIFFLILWTMFYSTFSLGQYPMDILEVMVGHLSDWLTMAMPRGLFSDLVINGIVAGAGSVIVFLPTILILFFFISLIEDTGYMARAAFMMDRIMHLAGLHGKSFIPLIMGFGCNAPAIMATRVLENKSDRLITILINPLMSCSARLPIYVLIAGSCFGNQAGNVIFSIYILGILLAIIIGRIFRKTLFKAESAPFVLELPPYRIPTFKSLLLHMWSRGSIFLGKVGGVIMIASVIIWALSSFPRAPGTEEQAAGINASFQHRFNALQSSAINSADRTEETARLKAELEMQLEALEKTSDRMHMENSYLGRLGKVIEPVVNPLGFGWREGVALISGFSAKEIVISTLGISYGAGSESQLGSILARELSPLAAYSFLVFTLMYIPCLGTLVVIYRELESLRWTVFAMFYTLSLAWVLSFIIFQGGRLLGLE